VAGTPYHGDELGRKSPQDEEAAVRGTSWHLTKGLGKREIVRRFDALFSDDLPASAYLSTRDRYFQDLSRAALRYDLVWMPASGDVTAIGPGVPTGDELAQILHRILDSTGIRNMPEMIDRGAA
jgi:hypothetical protein